MQAVLECNTLLGYDGFRTEGGLFDIVEFVKWTCSACLESTVSGGESSFAMSLSLVDLYGGLLCSAQAAVDNYFCVESGVDKVCYSFLCGCQSRLFARQQSVLAAPSVLLLHFKRWPAHDEVLQHFVELDDFIHVCGSSYQLRSAVLHVGERADTGHYVDLVSQRSDVFSLLRWYAYDDCTCSAVDKDAYLSSVCELRGHKAYICMYVRCDVVHEGHVAEDSVAESCDELPPAASMCTLEKPELGSPFCVPTGPAHVLSPFAFAHLPGLVGTASSCSANGSVPLPPAVASLAAPTNDDAFESHSDASCASDESDVCHLAAVCGQSKQWTTFEDEDIDRVARLASLLRSQPLLPPDPHNSEVSFTCVGRGLAFSACPLRVYWVRLV